jgi:polysaccharide export outer membrane protein
MITKISKLTLYLFLGILFLNSCAPVKNIAYFQKMGTAVDSSNAQKGTTGQYDARIKPKDILSITVVTSESEASKDFNLFVPQLFDPSAANAYNLLTTQPTLQTYLVDNDGTINFPVIGTFKVSGLTRKDLGKMLQEKLASAFNKEVPIITVRITNYSVNVVGEVLRPGKFSTGNDRMTIMEGIAMAGDLTIYGKRENVTVLRENGDGTKKYITVNLNDKNIIYSPAYYLEQNDVVYIEPNSAKARTSRIGAAETLSISALSILISVASIVINVLKP